MLDSMILYTIRSYMSGAESLSGIPGSVGGAIGMNAGAFGTEIKDIVTRIDLVNLEGESYSINSSEAGFAYRKAANISGSIVTSAEFNLAEGDGTALMAKRKDILNRRAEKQPLEFRSCGSVFKRPEGSYAGALIEKCGLKGKTHGGAMVSPKHANFIVNTGDASADDIRSLILFVKETVKKETGYELEEEVKYLGFE